MSIDMITFYEKCLLPLTPHPAVSKILELTMVGGETTEDISKVVALDPELDHWIRLTVQRLGFDRLKGLTQMITLLGQNRIRDMLIGRHIERTFIVPSDQIVAKLKNAKKPDAAKNPPPTKKAAAPATAKKADDEIIPSISDFQGYLQYANKAEEIAISIRNSYPGQAFAGGVLFDYCKYFLRKNVSATDLSDPRLQKTDAYIETVFNDGIRCGVAANEIIQKISIPHQKTVFLTALVHNLGKIILLAYDPKKFEGTFIESTGAKDVNAKIDSTVAEEQAFEFDHAQAGALYVGRLPFLSDIERSIDYHHNPHLLRFSKPGLFALAALLRVSGALTKLYQKLRESDPDIQHLKDTRLIASEEFKFLKLSEAEWADVKANYALKLMKVGM
jgi:hypothetical protein